MTVSVRKRLFIFSVCEFVERVRGSEEERNTTTQTIRQISQMQFEQIFR